MSAKKHFFAGRAGGVRKLRTSPLLLFFFKPSLSTARSIIPYTFQIHKYSVETVWNYETGRTANTPGQYVEAK